MNTGRMTRLSTLRRRLRDRQSIETGDALARLSESEQALHDARHAQAEFVSAQSAALQLMTCSSEVWRLAQQHELHAEHIERVGQETETLKAASRAAQAELANRTKDLRVVERAMEQRCTERFKSEQKQEQRQSDDLVAGRMKGQS